VWFVRYFCSPPLTIGRCLNPSLHFLRCIYVSHAHYTLSNASAVTSAEAFFSSQQAPDKLPSVLSHLYPTSVGHLVDYLQSMVADELVALKVQAYQLFSAIITAGSASHHQQVQWPQAVWSGAAVASLTAVSAPFIFARTLIRALVKILYTSRGCGQRCVRGSHRPSSPSRL
jgi:hypothetical protein